MDPLQKEVMLYGLDHHHGIIDGIIRELNIEANAFDVKLILAEAVTNAHYHGNQSDCTKPIYIRYLLQGNHLNLQVEDSGLGGGQRLIPDELEEDRLLDESGRGLYLIRCFSDNVELIDNTIHIDKTLLCL
jgi:serine/threonine-protein kinase RsbW